MVFKSFQSIYKLKQKLKSKSGLKIIINFEAILAKKNEKRCGKTIAWKNRAYYSM